MSDNKKSRGEPDRSKINAHETYEIQYWSEKYGVSAQQLKDAIHEVGNSPEVVERYLKDRKADSRAGSK